MSMAETLVTISAAIAALHPTFEAHVARQVGAQGVGAAALGAGVGAGRAAAATPGVGGVAGAADPAPSAPPQPRSQPALTQQ